VSVRVIVDLELSSVYARDEGDGKIATSSALAAWRSFGSGRRSELRDDHQLPDGRRCMRAYLLPWPV
jgi:hypothetical protein